MTALSMILGTLCYIQNGEDILMLHRVKKENDFHYGKWNGVGGKFMPGESPEECALREINEETGLAIHSLQLKGVITFPDFGAGPAGNHWYVFVFHAVTENRDFCECAEGNLAWIPKNKVLDLPLWPSDKLFIPYVFQKGFFSATFRYNGQVLEKEKIRHYGLVNL